MQQYYQRAFDEVVEPTYRTAAPPPGMTKERFARQHEAVKHLTEHLHEAPVWIIACRTTGGPGTSSRMPAHSAGNSIYPAVQNMLLAARALGLGATLTSRHLMFEREVNEILGIPEGAATFALLPIGYPLGNFGPVRRGPMDEVVFEDRWGKPYHASNAG